MQCGRCVAREGALLPESSTPGASEGGKIDVRAIRQTTVHQLTAHDTIPITTDTGQHYSFLKPNQHIDSDNVTDDFY